MVSSRESKCSLSCSARECAPSGARILFPLELTIGGWVGFFIKTKCPDASEARVRVREEFDLIVNWLEYC